MQPWEHSRAARLAGPIGLAAVTLGAAAALASVGLSEGVPAHLGPIACGSVALPAVLICWAWMLGAFGIGRLPAAVLARGSTSRLWIQLALGVGITLVLAHILGVLGLLSGSGPRARIAGWALTGTGLLLLADQVVRGQLRPERWPVVPVWSWLYAPALATILVAASNPPGWLWPSEFGAYDTLSYHLQLPKEWAVGARLWPSDHNVYSFLPSYVEAAYLHLATLMPGDADVLRRMLAGEGLWIIAGQMLHGMLGAAAALLTGRAAFVCVLQCGTPARVAGVIGLLTGALVLSTPWMVVVSSLAYNDAGMLAMFAGAVLIAVDTSMRPTARAIGAGLLIGVAASCKPTAAFMAAPVAGILLLGNMPRRAWAVAVVAGSLAGAVAVAPWLVRNWLASGNPVFPFAPGVFGPGRWTAEQLERYARNHHADPAMGAGARAARLVSAEFGLGHEQWSALLWIGAVALCVALFWSRSRRAALLLTAGLIAQGVSWGLLTHMQSRFLLPMLVPIAMVYALAGAAIVAWAGRAVPGRLTLASCLVLALVPVSLSARSVLTFMDQRRWRPNNLLFTGVGGMTGMAVEEQFDKAADSDQRDYLMHKASPSAFVNIGLKSQDEPDAGVYLLGEATPLYLLGASGDRPAEPGGSRVIYHTTWDTSPLGEAMRRHPDDHAAWTREIGSLGARYVMVNFDELSRLVRTDHYFDPAVTLEAVQQWLTDPASGLTLERVWTTPGAPPMTGMAIFRISEKLSPTRQP